jgi:hypothetical protein
VHGHDLRIEHQSHEALQQPKQCLAAIRADGQPAVLEPVRGDLGLDPGPEQLFLLSISLGLVLTPVAYRLSAMRQKRPVGSPVSVSA